jgi:hypothetical protein
MTHPIAIRVTVALSTLLLTVTLANAATRFVGPSGSGSACSLASPCSLATALSGASSGDTVVLNSGTYAGVTISTPNLTVTSTDAIKSALGTETCARAPWLTAVISSNGGEAGCGRFLGTDNRPLFTSAVNISGSGVTFEYMRVRFSSSRVEDGAEAVAVHAENVTVRYNEIFNGGQGVFIWVKRNVQIAHNYIHALGIKGTEFDTHNVGICGTGTESASFATQIRINNNTLQDGGGDGVQEQTNAYCSGTFSYLTVEANYMTDFDEQCGDLKGTRFLRWHWNECSVAPLGGINSTDDPHVASKTDWDIWDNYFHDIVYWAIGWSQTANCGRWRIWNNVVARTATNPPFNAASFSLCGDAGTYVVFNTFVDNSNGNAAPRTWAIYNFGASGGGNTGNNIRNNIFYRNGTGTDDRGHISAISGEDGGTPSTNYFNTPTTAAACGASCTVGTSPITSCFATNNCPGLTSITNGDYTLMAGSPAIHAGLTIGSHVSLTDSGNFTPSRDINGANRLGATDLGPFTFGVTQTQPPSAPTNLRIIG